MKILKNTEIYFVLCFISYHSNVLLVKRLELGKYFYEISNCRNLLHYYFILLCSDFLYVILEFLIILVNFIIPFLNTLDTFFFSKADLYLLCFYINFCKYISYNMKSIIVYGHVSQSPKF